MKIVVVRKAQGPGWHVPAQALRHPQGRRGVTQTNIEKSASGDFLPAGAFFGIFVWDAPYKWGKKSKERIMLCRQKKTQPYDTFEPLFDGSCEVPRYGI